MRLRKTALAAVTAVLAAACGTQSPTTTGGQTKDGNLLTVAVGIDADTWDPAAQTTTTVANQLQYVAESLVTIDGQGKLLPNLAEKWESTPDGLSYTFTLRKGVKFHDGTDFNAAAVKWSFDRLIGKTAFKAQPGILGDPSLGMQTTVVDDSHVKFTLKKPLAPFVAALTQTSFAITSPAAASANGNTAEKLVMPVGTGPYKWKEYVKGDHLSLIRNDSYWGPKVHFKQVDFKVVPEAGSREALVKAGQADLIILPPAADLPALKADPNLKVLLAPSDRSLFLNLNTQSGNPKLQDKRVRQAINYAVDKDTLIKNVIFGAGNKLTSPISNLEFGYCPTGDYAYNKDKARQLLADAGATNLTLRFQAPVGRYVQDKEVAQAVAGMLRDVGITVDGPNTFDWPTYLGKVNVPPDKSTADMHLLGWAASYLDAQKQLEIFQSSMIPPGGFNTSYYKSPEVDALIVKANTELDENARKTDYCAAMKKIWDDAPQVFLWTQSFPIVYSAKITGIGSKPNETFDIMNAAPA